MLIAGTGGHALEVFDVICEKPMCEKLFFFDNIDLTKSVLYNIEILHNIEDVYIKLAIEFDFVLGLGNSKSRRILHDLFLKAGGRHLAVQSNTSEISTYHNVSQHCDIMKNVFVGPTASAGVGTLLNTGAHIHHNVVIGDFCEISPGAILLGNVKVGNDTMIGSNATILPGITIGSNVIIAGGAVVIKDIPDNVMAAGNPASVKRLNATSD